MPQNVIADIFNADRIEFVKGSHRAKFVPPRLGKPVETGHFCLIEGGNRRILRRLRLKTAIWHRMNP